MRNNLFSMRSENKMSLTQLSEVCEVSRSHLSKIENGNRDPTVPVAYRICRALNKNIYEVFPDIVEEG